MKINKPIGEKIKNLRAMRTLSIEEVAERTGLSTTQLIHIEEDREFPSLAPLVKIARVLGVRLGTFLDDQQELGPVVYRKNCVDPTLASHFSNNAKAVHKNMSYFALSQDKLGRHMEPFLIDVMPSEKADFVFSTHEGEEFIYVLGGMIEITYGKEVYILEEGDCIYYDSIVAHHVQAGNQKTARILGVIYTPY